MLPDYPPQAKPITLRQILTHTSGIWSYTESEEFMTRDASLEHTPAQLIDTFKNHAADFEPGTKWNYSNSGYYLLGEIIAKASGKPYAEFVQEELFTPLGLTRTRYENNKAIIPNRAQGYSFDGKSVTNDRPIGADVPGAAGSLLSSAGDLVRWSVALASGKVVTPESYALMTTPAILPDGTDTKYGFGLKVDRWESNPRVSHGGGIFGFSSILLYYPEGRVSVAVISNCEAFGGGRIAELISRAALGIEDFKPQDLAVTPEEIARFAGEYKFETIPLEITFFEREGKLWGQASGQDADQLLSQGKGEFRASFDPNVRFVFSGGDGPAEAVTLFQRGEHKAKRKK